MKLLWVSCGTDDNLMWVSLRTHDYLEKNDVPHIFYTEPGGHNFKVWKNDLYQFSQLLFKPVDPSIYNRLQAKQVAQLESPDKSIVPNVFLSATDECRQGRMETNIPELRRTLQAEYSCRSGQKKRDITLNVNSGFVMLLE